MDRSKVSNKPGSRIEHTSDYCRAIGRLEDFQEEVSLYELRKTPLLAIAHRGSVTRSAEVAGSTMAAGYMNEQDSNKASLAAFIDDVRIHPHDLSNAYFVVPISNDMLKEARSYLEAKAFRGIDDGRSPDINSSEIVAAAILLAVEQSTQLLGCAYVSLLLPGANGLEKLDGKFFKIYGNSNAWNTGLKFPATGCFATILRPSGRKSLRRHQPGCSDGVYSTQSNYHCSRQLVRGYGRRSL